MGHFRRLMSPMPQHAPRPLRHSAPKAETPMQHPKAPADSLGGILSLVIGIAIFSVQDLILKQLSGAYPLHQAMTVRSLVALPLIYALVRREGPAALIFAPGWAAMMGRGWLNFLAYTAYYLALAALPMATTVALYFSAPLMITALSVWLLGDQVSRGRWLAVAAGFVGVVVMLRPGSDLFDWAALLPVISGAAYAASMILARRQGAQHSAAVLAFHSNAVFLIAALALSALLGSGQFATQGHPSLAFLLRGWVMPTGGDLALMAACGAIAAVGLTLLTQAYRIAPSAVVAPFEYTALIWGVVYGWLLWSDWPDATGWAGIALILGAGLFVLLHRDPAPKPAATP